jgi:hypothetical protein
LGAPRVSASWRGDFETGDLSQWKAVQAKERRRVTIQTDVVRQGQYAARVEVRPGDSQVAGSGSGERTDFFIGSSTTDGVEGQEQYWAWSTFFPEDFDAPMGAWNAFVGFHHTMPKGQSNMHFAVTNRKSLTLRVLGGNFNRPVRKDFVLAPLRRGHWYDFVFHVKWSSTRAGLVELWVNGFRVVRRTSTPTLYVGQGVYLKQGYYRSAYKGTTIVYHDGMRKGSTLADVANRKGNFIPD